MVISSLLRRHCIADRLAGFFLSLAITPFSPPHFQPLLMPIITF
jgi:hypothetical protein